MKNHVPVLFVLSTLLVLISVSCSQPDIPVADFEGNDYNGWVVEGEAFGSAPAILDLSSSERTAQDQRWIELNRGKLKFINQGYINSSGIGPQSTGSLTSPPVRVERRYLVFLYSGGDLPEQTGVDILFDGKVIQSITGTNSPALEWRYFDLGTLKGKDIQIRVFDRIESRRGRLQADHFYFSNDLPVTEKSITLKLNRKYINLPVWTGDPLKRMKLVIDDRVIDEFYIELADSSPQFYVFIDVEAYKGKTAILSTPSIEKSSKGFDFITVHDEIKGSDDLYQESLRQQIHFSTRRGWINDPNGLVYYSGDYHLYYQHNPYGCKSGNKHWGHAVSSDLVHWKELPIAIYPYSFNDWVFSGSAVMDPENTSGLKTGKETVMIAAYTSTERGEAIAFSNDKGRTFTDYPGNPVIEHQGRDPKIFWYQPGNHWVMAVYHEEDGKQWIAFYSSGNLKDWMYQSKVEGYYECPEIFELPVNGDKDRTRWVLYAADGAYTIGSFNGREYIPESGKIPNNYGNCFYASQTYNNIPAEDGRRIQIAWGRVNTPGMPFNQCMLFPTQLSLRTTTEGMRLFSEPVKEIELLHANEWFIRDMTIEPGHNPLKDFQGELYHIIAEFVVGRNSQVGFLIHGTEVLFDAAANELSCRDKKASVESGNGKIYFDIIVDRNTIEVFCNHGQVYMPIARDLSSGYGVELICRKDQITAESLYVFGLDPIWK